MISHLKILILLNFALCYLYKSSECHSQKLPKKLDYVYQELLFEKALPSFSRTIEEYDNEIYSIIIQYDSPSAIQLQIVKDSLGEKPYKHLLEQKNLHEIFDLALNIRNEIQEIDFFVSVLSFSADYKSNTKMIIRLGEKWMRVNSLDSLLVNSKLNQLKNHNAIVKSEYDPFKLEFKSFYNQQTIKKLMNYSFEGSSKLQEEYWNALMTLHNNRVAKLISLSKDFLKFSYTSFEELTDYIENNYPKISTILSN